jgi:hypothetical protein
MLFSVRTGESRLPPSGLASLNPPHRFLCQRRAGIPLFTEQSHGMAACHAMTTARMNIISLVYERLKRQFSVNFIVLNKFLLALCILPILNTTNLPAQENNNYWRKLEVDAQHFTSVTDLFNNDFSAKYPDAVPNTKLKSKKDYYRFVNFWKCRLGLIDDTTLSYTPYSKAGINNIFNPYCAESDSANWQLLGPASLDIQWLGLVTSVLSDPETPGHYLLSSDRGGIWQSRTTGNSWVNVTDNIKLPGLTATEMIRNPFDNMHIIASTSGGMHTAQYGMGIIESFNNGNTWSLQEGFPYTTCPYVQKVIYDPNDHNSNDGLTLWAITRTTNSGKIFSSSNTGVDWVEITGPPNVPNHVRFHDIEIDDQGSVWVTTSAKYNNVDGGVYKYQNGIWYDLSNLFENGIKYQQAALTKPYAGKIFVKVDDCNLSVQNGATRVYKTTNYGATWTFLVEPDYAISNKNQCEIEYSPESGIIYFGGIRVGLLKDDGSTDFIYFSPLHFDVRDFDFIGIDAENYENVLVATDGGITLMKVNVDDLSQLTLENLNGNHLPIGNFLGIGISHSDNEFIAGGTIHCNTFKYTEGQWKNFIVENSAGNFSKSLASDSENPIIDLCDNEIFTSNTDHAIGIQGPWMTFKGVDGGDSEVNWLDQSIYYYQANESMYTSSKPGIPIYDSPDNWFIGMKYELNPNDPYTVCFGRRRNGSQPAYFMIYDETTDNLTIRNAPPDVSAVGPIGINRSNILFFADYSIASSSTPNRFNKSIDDGLSWIDMSFKPVREFVNGNWITTDTLINVLAWRTIEDIIFNPDDPNEMWISIGGVQTNNGEPVAGKFRVLHSTDVGESWYDYSENLSPFPVMALEYQKGSNKRLFAGTDAGVYYRDESMSQWECFNSGLPICIITDLDYDPYNKVLYASTQGRAIYKTDVPFNDTVSSNPDSDQLHRWRGKPEKINITAIPNPSGTGEVLLEFENTGLYINMELRILDASGKEVHRRRIYTGQQDTHLDVGHWRPGLYLGVIFSNGGAVGRCKVVVE